MNRPNILYIHSHDTGRWISPYGYAVPTPHLQRFAEQGIVFRQAFSAAPICSPSRAALLCGQCSHSAGLMGLAQRYETNHPPERAGFRVRDYGHHIAHTLRRAGYYSALLGMQHIAEDPAVIGYDQVPSANSPGALEEALQFLSDPPRQPFFADIGFGETHRPFPSPIPDEEARFCLPPAHLPDVLPLREDMAAYKASARRLDDKIGAVLDALERSGLSEHTLVICTTDHGLAFPGMKNTMTDRGLGVLLMMRGPDGFEGGRVCDALVSHIDIFPTVCEMLSIEPPAWLEGRSMMPLIRGEAEQINEAIFAEVNFHAAYEPQRAVRTTRWKFSRRFDERPFSDGGVRPVVINMDNGPSKDFWLRSGGGERLLAREELYDLLFDPGEAHNLAGEANYSEVLQEMRDRLDVWMRATNDPLLLGPIPLPPGALVNDPDGLSAEDESLISCDDPRAP